MRAIWSGALSFGLVNIPVRLYSASVDREFKFHLLHKKDFSLIRYARVCRADGKEVPYEDIVKGYEYSKGDYVVLEDEDFERANARKTKAIELSGFVQEDEIDPIYFDTPYYLEPDGSDKAYALFREALAKSRKVGLARYVLRNRERVGVVKPRGSVLLLDQLRYQAEIRGSDELKLPQAKQASDKEVDMALKLINQLTQKFKPEEFKDTYAAELKAVIEKKAKGQKIEVKGQEPVATRVPDIMAMLAASLKEGPPERRKPSDVRRRTRAKRKA